MSHLAGPNWIADGVNLVLPLVALHTTKLHPLSKRWILGSDLMIVNFPNDFLPWKHIWHQQDSPTPTLHAFYLSSHPTLLLSERKGWNPIGLYLKTHLVLTNTEKPCTVWTEVNVIDLLLVGGKIVHLKSHIRFKKVICGSFSIVENL